VVKNRKSFLKILSIKLDDVVAMQEVHSNHIYIAEAKDKGKGAFSKADWIENVDGLLTREKDVFLFGTFADCLPIFFLDPKRQVVGLAHAGWRGVSLNICEQMISKMRYVFQCSPKDILVSIGPSIGPCCFEIQEDILPDFKDFRFREDIIIRKNNRIFIDLWQICFDQLKEMEVSEGNIEISEICTSCEKDIYSSHRRDKENTITMGGVIGIKIDRD